MLGVVSLLPQQRLGTNVHKWGQRVNKVIPWGKVQCWGPWEGKGWGRVGSASGNTNVCLVNSPPTHTVTRSGWKKNKVIHANVTSQGILEMGRGRAGEGEWVVVWALATVLGLGSKGWGRRSHHFQWHNGTRPGWAGSGVITLPPHNSQSQLGSGSHQWAAGTCSSPAKTNPNQQQARWGNNPQSGSNEWNAEGLWVVVGCGQG